LTSKERRPHFAKAPSERGENPPSSGLVQLQMGEGARGGEENSSAGGKCNRRTKSAHEKERGHAPMYIQRAAIEGDGQIEGNIEFG